MVGLGGGNVDIATAGSIQGVNINATNSFYFPNSNLLMYPTVSTGDSGNAYTFTDAGGSNLRQIKARSVWIGATQGGAQLAGINSSGGGYFSGNVGIGTSLPTSKLTISGGTIQIIDGTQ